MKKSLLLTVVTLLAWCGFANATVTIISTNIEQPANDTLMFALPVDPEISQEIWTAYVHPNGEYWRSMKFQAEYLVTAQDFTKGDPSLGTPTLPANAKVIGLGLDGFDIGSETVTYQGVDLGVFHEVTAWCRNIPREKLELDYLDLLDGYNTHLPQGQLCTDTITYRGYTGKPGKVCTFDLPADSLNPCAIVEIPFGHPDDTRLPFWYKGENIYLTLWLCNWFDVQMKYKYMAYDDAEAEYASLMRGGHICFNSESQYDLYDYMGMDLMYELPKHRLPAFRTPYYTNDVRVTYEGLETVIEVKDAEGNVVTPAADGNYYGLDHTMEYGIYTNNKLRGTFTFDDIYKDIDLFISTTITAVEEIDVNKDVANVRYYNLAGQEMPQANGVTIVVTTYTDGSTTTAKVIK